MPGTTTAADTEVPDRFFFLGVDTDHRITGGGERGGLIIEIGELRIPVDVLAALDGLGVACRQYPLAFNNFATIVGDAR